MAEVDILIGARSRTDAAFDASRAAFRRLAGVSGRTAAGIRSDFARASQTARDMARSYGQAVDRMDDLADAADRAEDQVEGLAHTVNSLGDAAPAAMLRQLQRLRDEADRTRGQFEDAEDEVTNLGRALVAARIQAGQLADEAGQVDRGFRGMVRRMQRVGADAGERFGSAFEGAARPALYAAVATLSPIIASALSSAVLLGLGGGVLAAGIKLAASDPAVKQAAGALKDRALDRDITEQTEAVASAQEKVAKAEERLAKARAANSKAGVKSAQADLAAARQDLARVQADLSKAEDFNRRNVSLRDVAKPFVDPLTRFLTSFTAGLDTIIPRIGGMFAAVAPVLDKLGPAFISMIEKALPGIEEAVAASVPLFETLAEHAPKLGESISLFFRAIAESGPEANQIFGTLLTILEALIIWLGGTIKFATEFYATMINIWTGIKEHVKNTINIMTNLVLMWAGVVVNAAAKAFGWLPGVGDDVRRAAQSFNDFRDTANAALAGINDRTVNVTAQLTTVSVDTLSPARRQHGGLATGLILAGERGIPELIETGAAGARVRNGGETRQLLSGGGGPTETTVNITVAAANSGSDPLAAAFVEMLRSGRIRMVAGNQSVRLAY